jgi:hypothetical protein
MGRLCQTSLRWSATGLKLPGKLHTPRRLKQPAHYSRRCAPPERHLRLSRLPARLTAQGVNPFRPRVHPALQPAYPASGTGTIEQMTGWIDMGGSLWVAVQFVQAPL